MSVGEAGLILRPLPLGLRQGDLVRPRVDFGEDLPGPHDVSFGEVHADELAVQTAAHNDRIDRGHGAEPLEDHRDTAAFRLDHTDGRRIGTPAAPAASTPAATPAAARTHALRDRLTLANVVVPDEKGAARQNEEPEQPLTSAIFGGASTDLCM